MILFHGGNKCFLMTKVTLFTVAVTTATLYLYERPSDDSNIVMSDRTGY